MSNFSACLRTLAVAGLLLSASSAFAQGTLPPTGGPVPGAPDPTAVPLDGGATLLAAAGIGLGIRKLRARLQR